MGVQLEAAPVCKFSSDGSQIMLGDLTKPFVASAQPQGTDKIFERSLRQAGPTQPSEVASSTMTTSQSENMNLNTVLLYNCAAMCY